ncbi:MAG: DUF4089 domain-containing protein [Curvibacter lanceolatus]|jgi:hypothetical protein|uniref:DUF4089 domain-containing protein n=1 Tax=Curvibacter lanceolatus TaxID=86182 RepID=UPI0003770A9A|nr:DUF4089 domain-containing protein [Curvibacter lanceolatus]MBV5294243.1 DUF4089 domain-containing protein [Curvibacter lanceolatus]
MSPDIPPEALARYVEAAADALGLSLTPEQRPGVLAFFGMAARFAAVLEATELHPHDESALHFEPVAVPPAPPAGPTGGEHAL